MSTIIGIDPGQSGGICVFDVTPLGSIQGKVEPLPIMPTGKGDRQQLDMRRLVDIIAAVKRSREIDLAVVEEAPTFSKGMLAIASLHRGYGEIRGILASLNIRAAFPSPKTWKAAILAGKAHDKTATIAYVLQRFPSFDITLPAKKSGKNKGKVEYHDGLADAICICEYGRRQLIGEAG